MKVKALLLLVVLSFPLIGFTQLPKHLKKGFEALRVFNYFEAKAIFYDSFKRNTSAASAYGLALIYQRKDNPFSNTDSAVKYAQIAFSRICLEPRIDSAATFVIDRVNLLDLLERSSNEHFAKTSLVASVGAWDHFLEWNSMCAQGMREDAIRLRDQLELDQVKKVNLSATTKDFLRHHPCSPFYKEAILLFEQQVYEESCPHKTLQELRNFLQSHPKSNVRPIALAKLYEKSLESNDLNDLVLFVKQFPEAPQNHECWKWLFSKSVKAYSDSELVRFISHYPEFPLKSSILRELEFSKLLLLPVVLEERFVYVDTIGKIRIQQYFDQAGEFSEELAVVERNDSTWYINKRGENVFAAVFEEAFPFYSGSAAVKVGGNWFFINRQGQKISPFYEEINELSNDLYVVRTQGFYGAIDRYGQGVVSARFQNLGDFKNGYAIYRKAERYGFVSIRDQEYPPEFDWISDFDVKGLAIFRMNNSFGLVNTKGEKRLLPNYDQILPLSDANYLLMKDNKYGFFRAEGCFVCDLNYDFQIGKDATFYYKNGWYRLQREKHVAMMDGNGILRVNFKVFEDLGFVQEGLIRVKKKNKYGFVDSKLQTIINLNFLEAGDFSGGRCIVKRDSGYELIGPGMESYIKTAESIERLSDVLFLVRRAGEMFLCDAYGQVLFAEISQVQKLSGNYLALILKNSEIKILKLNS